jgi:transposase
MRLLNRWTLAWLTLICESVNIATLCFYRPHFDFKFMIWYTKKALEKKIEEGK